MALDRVPELQVLLLSGLALGGASEIRESLTTCLRSVPAKWELAEAAGASVSVPLTLTIDEA